MQKLLLHLPGSWHRAAHASPPMDNPKKRKMTEAAVKITVLQTLVETNSSDAPFNTDTLYPEPASEYLDAAPVFEAISSDPTPTKTWKLTMTRKLTIFQANVGKWKAPHYTALATAWERKFDIALIQEPHFTKINEIQCPIRHPGFTAFSPIDIYEEGLPDVLTYVRIRPGLQASQVILPNPQRGTLWIKVQGVTIANI